MKTRLLFFAMLLSIGGCAQTVQNVQWIFQRPVTIDSTRVKGDNSDAMFDVRNNSTVQPVFKLRDISGDVLLVQDSLLKLPTIRNIPTDTTPIFIATTPSTKALFQSTPSQFCDAVNGCFSPYDGVILDTVASSGATVILGNRSSHIITSSSTITGITLNLPSATTGDYINVIFNRGITATGVTYTGSGTATCKFGTTAVEPTNSGAFKTYINYGGNWH